MTALQQIVFKSGQKTHERLYGSTFIFNNREYPCTHSYLNKNPMFVGAGFSPDAEVLITIRQDVFGPITDNNPLPSKERNSFCSLRSTEEDNAVFDLKVDEVMFSPGDLFYKFRCVDRNQSA